MLGECDFCPDHRRPQSPKGRTPLSSWKPRVRSGGLCGALFVLTSVLVPLNLLELGGDSPCLVFADCKLDAAVNDICGLKFANGGLTTGLRPDGSVESVNLGYPWWWYALVGTYVMHGNEHPKR